MHRDFEDTNGEVAQEIEKYKESNQEQDNTIRKKNSREKRA